ncbi:helix-turn-helix domain-containing protein [Rufibacter immobilis]|nr:helix-turn-helix domain-containing protein [Rufibacter immobilis]
MDHKGEILEKAVRESGIRIADLAKKLRISRGTLYNRFEEYNLDWSFMSEVGKIINKDFSYLFTDIPKSVSNLNNDVQDNAQEFKTLSDCTKELLATQRKYIALLERHNQLLESR